MILMASFQTISPQSKAVKKAIGRWRITSMVMWDNDFMDAEVPAHITIHKNMQGDFQFGFVQGEIDGRTSQEGDLVIIDFSWSGFDENDPASGRGWMQISGNTGTGCFYFHMGDESDFTVIREDLPAN